MSARSARFLTILVLVGATLAVFGPIAVHDFVGWDDDINLYDNAYLDPVSSETVLHFWRSPYFKLYIPVTYTLWSGLAWAAQTLHPDSPALRDYPAYFHIASLVLHTACVLLAFSLLEVLLRKAETAGDPRRDSERAILWPAAAGALLFALHPLQAEPVAWATGMKDLLAGFFSLLALLAYARSAVAPSRGGRMVRYALATAFFFLGLLSKPSAAAVPFVAISLDFWVLRRPPRKSVAAAGLWAALLVPWFLLVRKLQPPEGIRSVPPLWARPLIAGDSLAFYLRKLAWPFRLAPDYGRTPEAAMASHWIYIAWLVPVALVVLIVVLRGFRSILLGSFAVFVAGALPVLGLVAFQHQNISTVADRYLYLSMLGPALALAFFLRRCQGFPVFHRRAATAAAALLIVLLAARSAAELPNWRDTLTLFGHVIEVNPASAASHSNLGHALWMAGRNAEAKGHYEAALRLNPQYGIAWNNLGNLYLFEGKTEAAVEQYTKALESSNRDDVADALNNLGIASDRLGRTDEAIGFYRRVLAVRPDYDKAYNNLAHVLARKGQFEEAIGLYWKAIELKPNYADARRNLSVLLNDLGFELAKNNQLKDAVALYEEAIRVRPDFLTAIVNLGETRVALGDPDGAARLWIGALQVLPRSAELRHNLAVLFLRKGDRPLAREHLQEALRLQPDLGASRKLLQQLDQQPGDSSEASQP
jgi:tetratricopeptide (TPR) repeat protein